MDILITFKDGTKKKYKKCKDCEGDWDFAFRKENGILEVFDMSLIEKIEIIP